MTILHIINTPNGVDISISDGMLWWLIIYIIVRVVVSILVGLSE